MASATHLLSCQPTVGLGWLEYRYNEPDDLEALRFFLYRNLGREAGPLIYIEPFEGTFLRREGAGAITILSLPVTAHGNRALTPTYREQMQFVIGCYGHAPDGESGRAATIALGRRVWRLLQEGEPGVPPWRVQMYARAYDARVARFLRVLPDSLSMGLEDTTDLGLWKRTIEITVEAPRQRDVTTVPSLAAVGVTL